MSLLINPYALSPVAPAATREFRALKTQSGVNASSFTISACDIGAAAVGRVVVAGLFMGAVNNRTFDSVTIGGVAARVSVQQSWQYISAYYRAAVISAPLAAGATADIAVTLSGSSGAGAYVAAATYKTIGLQSNTEIDFSSSQSTGNTSRQLLVDVEENGLMFDFAYLRGASTSVDFSMTGATEDFDSTVGTQFFLVGGSHEVTADETDRAGTILAGSSFSGSMVAASFR